MRKIGLRPTIHECLQWTAIFEVKETPNKKQKKTYPFYIGLSFIMHIITTLQLKALRSPFFSGQKKRMNLRRSPRIQVKTERTTDYDVKIISLPPSDPHQDDRHVDQVRVRRGRPHPHPGRDGARRPQGQQRAPGQEGEDVQGGRREDQAVHEDKGLQVGFKPFLTQH